MYPTNLKELCKWYIRHTHLTFIFKPEHAEHCEFISISSVGHSGDEVIFTVNYKVCGSFTKEVITVGYTEMVLAYINERFKEGTQQ